MDQPEPVCIAVIYQLHIMSCRQLSRCVRYLLKRPGYLLDLGKRLSFMLVYRPGSVSGRSLPFLPCRIFLSVRRSCIGSRKYARSCAYKQDFFPKNCFFLHRILLLSKSIFI